MILNMPGSALAKSCLFAVFAVFVAVMGLPGRSGAEAASAISVNRDNEKTVFVIESPRSNGNEDADRTCELLQNLIIDTRGEDGKGSDSDRRGRRKHP
jgi:hypothetical protein